MKSLLVAVASLALTACGGATGDTRDSASPTPKSTATATATPSPTIEPTPDTSAYEICELVMGPLLEAVRQLDSRLTIGQTFVEYGDRLEEITVEYDRIVSDPDRVNRTMMTLFEAEDCWSVGALLEDAYNAYTDAYRQWDACINDPSCDNDSITPDLQAFWATAEEKLAEAQHALAGMRH